MGYNLGYFFFTPLFFVLTLVIKTKMRLTIKLLMAVILIPSWVLCQKATFSIGSDAFVRVNAMKQAANGDLLLASSAGLDANETRATLFQHRLNGAEVWSTKFGDPGSSKWRDVAVMDTRIVTGGGITSDTRGVESEFSAATHRDNGDLDRIYATSTFPEGSLNGVFEIESIDGEFFVAAGQLNFDFGQGPISAPNALVSSYKPNGGFIDMGGWDLVKYGEGYFKSVEIVDDGDMVFLFEGVSNDSITGYKLFKYDYPSGDMLWMEDLGYAGVMNDLLWDEEERKFYIDMNVQTDRQVKPAIFVTDEFGNFNDVITLLTGSGFFTINSMTMTDGGILGAGHVGIHAEDRACFIYLDLATRQSCITTLFQDGAGPTSGTAALSIGNDVYLAGNQVVNGVSEAFVWIFDECLSTSVTDAKPLPNEAFPNPVSGVLNVDFEGAFNASVIDAHGRILKTIQGKEKLLSI